MSDKSLFYKGFEENTQIDDFLRCFKNTLKQMKMEIPYIF